MKLLIVLFMLLMIQTCNLKNNVQTSITRKIVQTCKEQSNCTIDLTDLTNFEWDRLYVFRPAIIDIEIKDMIDKDVTFAYEFSYKYVFIKNDIVVYTEEHHVDFDRFADGTVVFEMTGTENRFALITKNSTFNVRIDKRKTGTTYYLTCTNCK